jgi:hypothetical protein
MRLSSAPSFVLLLCTLLPGCAEDAIQPSTDTTDTGAAGTDTLTSSSDTATGSDTATTTPDGDVPPADTAPLPDGGTPTSPDCDLNGRWLLSQHTVATALGQTQASHNWFYYEVAQVGDAVTVTKGLHCGYQVNKISTFGASVSSQKAWPAFLTHCSDTGRKGTFKLSGTSCTFGLDKQYAVRGASIPYYMDPSKPLPGKTEQASGSTPGWEDWEPDTKPGITLTVSGTASGDLYLVQRDWTQYAGTVGLKTVKFMVPITWDTEASVLGSTNSIIETKGVPDSNKSLHYVWWAKLSAGQATGTDAQICDAVRTLKSTLVPEADKD